jgi:putative ABC transport system substrate-binding protein
MRRREFLSIVAGAVAVSPVVAWAQQSQRRRLIGWLGGASQAAGKRNLNAFLEGLREHGYEDGKNIDVAYRWADGSMSGQAKLAKELVALGPDVIVTSNDFGNVAARQATTTIPIVGALVADPVNSGLAESYNRPGFNVTGILSVVDTLPGKRLELLLELVPRATKIGVLINPGSTNHPEWLRGTAVAARERSVAIIPVEARTPSDFDGAFAMLKEQHADGLVVLGDAMFFAEIGQILALAEKARLPAIHSFRQHVEQGGLMSYGVDVPQNFKRAAYFVDRILKGSRPADLPIEFPARLQLVINHKAAKTLGIEVPPKLLFTADEVID